VDNRSRRGTEKNLAWLLEQRPEIDFHQVDIRDFEPLAAVISERKPDLVLHLAAQVAVTTSYTNPREDFEINALGSFNVMEAVRLRAPEAFVLYASTNKVYGGMETVPVVRGEHG
jgi:CDP-paratose 2-epimerase